MSAVTASIGVTSVTSPTLINKASYSKKVEVKVIPDHTGAFGAAASYGATGDFSYSGQGDYPSVVAGASTGAPSDFSGGVTIIESVSKSEKSDDFPSYDVKGKWFPDAS